MALVRDWMVEKGLSNSDMAELTGMTVRTIINWAEGHKEPQVGVLLLMQAVDGELISLDWWKDRAKATKGEQK